MTSLTQPEDWNYFLYPAFTKFEQFKEKLLLVANKVDLTEQLELSQSSEYKVLPLSAKTGHGIKELKNTLKDIVGFKQTSEGSFIARRRHLDAIERALEYCENGKQQLEVYHAGELLADELRQAQNALSEITGEFTADDLLGRIFSSFCIGK